MNQLWKRMICMVLVISLLDIHPQTVRAAETTVKTEISYEGISVENNAGVNDYIRFTNLNYIHDKDKGISCTFTLYRDEQKLNKIKSTIVNYKYLQGRDYSWNLGTLLGKESGSIYLTFKYSGNEESDVIKLDYEEEKTSPAIDLTRVSVVNKYNGTAEKIHVTVSDLDAGDTVYVFKKGSNDAFTRMGTLLCENGGSVTGNYTRAAGLDKIYLTQKKNNQYESIEKQELAVPEAGITSYGTPDSDYPDVKIVAKDQTGNDVVEVSGVGAGTIVTLYTDESKSKKIKSQTINTNGTISVTNILNYGTIFVALRAPDKYEGPVIPVSPVLALKTKVLEGDIRLENNSGTNDYIRFLNLKYTEEEFKNTGVSYTLYADREKKTILYSGTISSSYLQGDKEYAVSIGKKLGKNSGIAYISFKYATQTESELVSVPYEEEKYSPVINPDNVFIVNKYTGSAERIYVTVNALCPGDVVYAYKLSAKGTYIELASKTCQSASDSATVSFAKPADADSVYLQIKRPNQYDSLEKTKIDIPEAEITTYGAENTDLPGLVLKPVDKTGNDLLEVSGAIEDTKVVVYTDEEKTKEIASATVNSSGSIAISNIMDYEVLYVTVRVPDKYESSPIRIVPVAAPKSQITYKKIYINNFTSDVGDSLCFDGLQYAEEEDSKTNLVLNVFSDQEKSSVLYSGTVSYSKLQGTDYSISLDDTLGLESGVLYVSVKYPAKRESDLIPVPYEGEKTSPVLKESQVVIESDLVREDFTKITVKVKVPDKKSDDLVKVYLSREGTDALAAGGEAFCLPQTTESIFVTIQNKGCYESARTEIKLPKARSCSTEYGNVEVENNAGIYPDRICYREDQDLPEGTVFSAYLRQNTREGEYEYRKLGSAVIKENRAEIVLEDNKTLGEEKGIVFTTLTYPGYAESAYSDTAYEGESIYTRIGLVRSDENDQGRLTVMNIKAGDTIRVYADREKNRQLAQVVSTGSSVQISVSADIGDTVYITNQAQDREESEVLPYTFGTISQLDRITMDSSFADRTYSVTLDFSQSEEIMVGIVRLSGMSAIDISILDETGKQIAEDFLGVNAERYALTQKRWMIVKKPQENRDVYTYNVRVSQREYKDNTVFRLVSGDADRARELLSGKENVVELPHYQDPELDKTVKGYNFVSGEYIPGRKNRGCFYRFEYRGNTDTITLRTKKANLEFCIYDETGLNVYDTSKESDTWRTKWIFPYTCVRKARESLVEKLTIGQEYLLEVYSADGTEEFTKDLNAYVLAVGDPIMMSGSDTVYAKTAFVIPKNQFSDTFGFQINNDLIPNTAIVSRLTPKDNSGKKVQELTAIEKFRVRNTSENYCPWSTCSGFFSSCEFAVGPYGILGTHVKGRWEIEAYSSETITIIPGFLLSYYYELGD